MSPPAVGFGQDLVVSTPTEKRRAKTDQAYAGVIEERGDEQRGISQPHLLRRTVLSIRANKLAASFFIPHGFRG
jgi:hypothetical protein